MTRTAPVGRTQGPVTAARPTPAEAARRAAARRVLTRGSWGRLPELTLVSATGLLIVAGADALSRWGYGPRMEGMFWVGLLTFLVPITLRLLMPRVGRNELLGLVVVYGLSLYLIKYMQSPFSFTYADEFVHLFNTNQIISTGRLYGLNTILPATPYYPGLAVATAGLSQLLGLDGFGAGLVVTGLARLVMTVALFLFFERLTASARVAALSTLLYAANPNYMFWSVQFSYESLALPLAMAVLAVLLRREQGRAPAERLGLTATALLLTGAIVVTHHLTSYFLVGVLTTWTLLASLLRNQLYRGATAGAAWLGRTRWGARVLKVARRALGRPASLPARRVDAGDQPNGIALIATVITLVWLFNVATLTVAYLSPVFLKAVTSVMGSLAGETSARELFQSDTGTVAPLWERLAGIGSVVLSLVGLPFGLREVWRRRLYQPAMLLCAGLAVAYFGGVGLRLIPEAWEIGNRSGEFLFLGLAVVLAYAHPLAWLRGRWQRLARPALTAAIVLITMGGTIAGWPPPLRTALPNVVQVGDQEMRPAGWTAAQWFLQNLGPDHIVAAQEAPGRYMFGFGQQYAFITHAFSIKSVFRAYGLQAWQIDALRAAQIEYVLMDRRRVSNNGMQGYFFEWLPGTAPVDDVVLDPAIYAKFDGLPEVSRIFDAGSLVIYDVRALTNGAR